MTRRRLTDAIRLAGCLLSLMGAAGCHAVGARHHAAADCYVPGVPRELEKVSLPLYTIEPPDILLIEAVNNLRLPDDPLRPGDGLLVRAGNTIPVGPEDDEIARSFKQVNGIFVVRTDGRIDLGPEYGTVLVGGLPIDGAKSAIENQLRTVLQNPQVSVALPQPQGRQAISGEHLVGPDGTVSLGIYGSVYVAGMTKQDAKFRIEQHLSQSMSQPEVHVDVLGYNSKVYYVITDGGGAGEQVLKFPSTGNETVLDAISQINGLPIVASKKHIWIARPAPASEGGCDQVLPVDWNAIARGGATATNYQIFPGDRVYVRADHLVTFDTFVGKVTSPFERMMGFVLLGNGTTRAVQFGHRQIGGVGGQPGF